MERRESSQEEQWFQNYYYQYQSFLFHDKILEGDLFLSKDGHGKSFRFIDVKILGNLTIELTHINSIEFRNVTVSGKISIRAGNCHSLTVNTLEMQECDFTLERLIELSFQNLTITQKGVIKCKSVSHFKINPDLDNNTGTVKLLQIETAEIGNLSLNGISEYDLFFYRCTVKNALELETPINNLEFNNCRFIEKFYALSITVSHQLRIVDTTFEDYFQFFTDVAKLENQPTSALLYLKDVTFEKKAIFDGLKLENFILLDNTFEASSSFNYLESKNANFKNNIFSKSATFEYANIDNADRDTFRTIKAELLKTNNYLDAYKFQAKELDEYHKNMRHSFNDSIVLFFNKISNNFGQAWLWGIAFTLYFSILFFSIYIISLKKFVSYNEIIKNYFKFLIVTHDQDFMKSYEPETLSYAIDSIARIFISYGIVQTVQAFRKHSKG
jgi:hypothetical protein